MSIELLAPAGSVSALKAVTNAGADAVYIGASRFGARAYADNPDEDALLHAMDYAHIRGVKVYLTVNTLLKDREIDELCSFMRPYVENGVDAVLVQDYGVMRLLHEAYPSLPLHASTQMTITGPKWSSVIKQYGVTRVVPARELSVTELRRIREESGLEVETFVHGALCYCYSGACLMSSMIGGRSGNRGRCAQPCRLLNLLNDREGFDGRSSILDRKDARHFLSPKDLCAASLIPELIAAGIDSLKIEGRMKQPEYAAGVVSVYRDLIDRAVEDPGRFRVRGEEEKKLYDLYNRSGFTDGYFHRQNGPEMMALVKHELTPEETERRHALYEEMHAKYLDEAFPVPVTGSFSVRKGRPIAAEVSCGSASAKVQGLVAETAAKRPLTAERIRENVMKTGGSDFVFTSAVIDTDEESFVPMSALNDLRRQALSALREEMLRAYRRTLPDHLPDDTGAHAVEVLPGRGNALPHELSLRENPLLREPSGRGAYVQENPLLRELSGRGASSQENPMALSVLAASREQFEAALDARSVSMIYAEAAMLASEADALSAARRFIAAARKYGKMPAIAMPRVDRAGRNADIFVRHAEELIAEGLCLFLIRAPETLGAFLEKGLQAYVRADASIYTMNRHALSCLSDLGVSLYTAPLELNKKELRARMNRGSEVIVYGATPLMLSAQCLKKNTEGCTKKNARMTLTDRTGTKFTVKCECVFCYNILYNYLPLCLLSETDELRSMGFSSARVEFSGESREEAERILAAAEAALSGRKPELPEVYTRGHYQRGVE